MKESVSALCVYAVYTRDASVYTWQRVFIHCIHMIVYHAYTHSLSLVCIYIIESVSSVYSLSVSSVYTWQRVCIHDKCMQCIHMTESVYTLYTHDSHVYTFSSSLVYIHIVERASCVYTLSVCSAYAWQRVYIHDRECSYTPYDNLSYVYTIYHVYTYTDREYVYTRWVYAVYTHDGECIHVTESVYILYTHGSVSCIHTLSIICMHTLTESLSCVYTLYHYVYIHSLSLLYTAVCPD